MAPDRNAPRAMPARMTPVTTVDSPTAEIRYSGRTKTRANSPMATISAVALPQLKVG